jgi:hypothetical protein
MQTTSRPTTYLNTRQDSTGRWHIVRSTPCEECGCPYHYSIDEPGLVWEAGDEISAACTESMCDCHLNPLKGLTFKLNLAS